METCFKILQLKFDQKLTNRCIGLTMKISASTVFEVLARFKASSLPWPLPEAISHDGLEKLIFPAKGTPASERVMPDLLHFNTEMRKSGVTRQLLWMEYKAQAGELAMGYSHFCRCYREWKKKQRPYAVTLERSVHHITTVKAGSGFLHPKFFTERCSDNVEPESRKMTVIFPSNAINTLALSFLRSKSTYR